MAADSSQHDAPPNPTDSKDAAGPQTPGKDSRRHARLALQGDHYALIQMPGGEERLEPLLDLGPEGAAVLLRVAHPVLAPGTLLPRVRLFSYGSCALDTTANVREVTQVAIEGGGIGQKLGLQLEPPKGTRGAEASVDTYEQAEVIADTVASLQVAQRRLSITPAGEKGSRHAVAGVIIEAQAADGRITVDLETATGAAWLSDRDYDLQAEHLGRTLALRARLVEQGADGRLRFDWPRTLMVWRARAGSRLRDLEDAHVLFETPFVRERRMRPAIDVAPRGVAFVAGPDDGLMVGMVLPGLTLKLPGAPGDIVGRGIVRHVRQAEGARPVGRDAGADAGAAGGERTFIVGVELTGLSVRHDEWLAGFIEQKVHPRVRRAGGDDLRQLWPLYEQVGLVRRTQGGLQRLELERKTLVQRGSQVLLAWVGGAQTELEGTVELVRTYPSTWSLQHLAILPGSRLTPDQLVVPAVESVLQRPHFGYLHALLPPSRPGALEHLRTLPQDGASVGWREWSLLTVSPGYTPPGTGEREAHDPRGDELTWVLQKLETTMRPLERLAFALERQELGLESLTRTYRALSLDRRRLVRVTSRVSEPHGYSLVEQSSPGINFAGFGDVCRLVPAVRLEQNRRAAAAALAHDAIWLQRGSGRQVLLLIEPALESALTDIGLVSLGTRVELVANRDGAAQVANFITLLL